MTDPRYAAMRWNTPLSTARADELLAAVGTIDAGSVLDLGCGWGELLLRAAAGFTPSCHGIGVDSDATLIARAERAASDRGLSTRVAFVAQDATGWREPAEIVFCIGASHAWGGATATLRAMREVVSPGGRLLFGDGCWTAPPTPAALEVFGDDVVTLDALEAAAVDTGWRTVTSSTATLQEWDEFEGSFRVGRERWAAANPDDPRSAALAAEMAARREEYETVYRGVLGFAYLVLET